METSVSFFYVLSVMNLLYVPLSGAHRGAPAARAAPPRESEENPCVATKFCTSVWNLHIIYRYIHVSEGHQSSW